MIRRPSFFRLWQACLCFALASVAQRGMGQNLVYVEPGLAACPAPPAPAASGAKTVKRGAPVPGNIRVSCGFDKGSYTVTLNSTDPGAAFSPRTFLVNFGRIVGNGAYSVKFATEGVQRISAAITSNMGSPAVQGQFVSPNSEFNVVPP